MVRSRKLVTQRFPWPFWFAGLLTCPAATFPEVEAAQLQEIGPESVQPPTQLPQDQPTHHQRSKHRSNIPDTERAEKGERRVLL